MPRKRPALGPASHERADMQFVLRVLEEGGPEGWDAAGELALPGPNPDALLQDVITWLESEHQTLHVCALVILLARGPLNCPQFFDPATADVPQVTALRDDVLAYLRSIVAHAADITDKYGVAWNVDAATMAIRHPISFRATMSTRPPAPGIPPNLVFIGAIGDTRDLVILQLQLVLHLVGLRNIAKCAATDCPHLFVKWYRRECCSTRCQKRHYKRQARQQALEERARQEERRRRERARRT